MAEALLALAGLLLAAAALATAEALLDARAAGSPRRGALLAPLADAARALRRPGGARLPALAGALAAAGTAVLLGTLALPALAAVLLAAPAVAAAWSGAGRRPAAAGRALAVQAPAVLALAAPAVAAGGPGTSAVLAAQAPLWGAVTTPAAAVLVLAGALTATGRGPFRRAAQDGRPPAGRLLLVAIAAAVAVVLLGGGAGPAVLPGVAWSALKTAAVLAVLVGVDRALPALLPDRALRTALVIALPLAVLQLGLAALPALLVP